MIAMKNKAILNRLAVLLNTDIENIPNTLRKFKKEKEDMEKKLKN